SSDLCGVKIRRPPAFAQSSARRITEKSLDIVADELDPAQSLACGAKADERRRTRGHNFLQPLRRLQFPMGSAPPALANHYRSQPRQIIAGGKIAGLRLSRSLPGFLADI